MIRRSAHFLLRFVAGLAAGLAIMVGFGLWLLSRGPLTLDTVAPLVASILSRGNGLAITIDHTLLSIAGGKVLVTARGVHLQREGSEAALTLGDLLLEFNPASALTGIIAPTRIIVNHPELRLARRPDGSFHLGVGDLEEGASEDWGQKLVGDLVHPPDGKGALGFLTELRVQNASLTVEDRAFNLEWHAAEAEASLERASDRTAGRFHIVAGQGAGETKLDGDFTLLPAAEWLVVRLAFSELKPSMWSDAAPALADMAALDVPISGELRAEFDPNTLTMRDTIADFKVGKGTLRQALFPNGALPIAGASFQAGYDAAQGRLNLGLFALDLGPGTIGVTGTVDGLGGDLLTGGKPQTIDAALAFSARGLRIDDFRRYWPDFASPSSREWVTEHMHGGGVDELAAKVDMHADLSPGAAKPVELRQFGGTMSFSNLTIEYFHPLAPVTGVRGTAKFDRTSIEFSAATGDVGNIHASAATARFDQLDTHDEQAKITVAAQGPLADALAVLDTAPLYYAREIGLDPKRAGGNFTAQLHFNFPLLNHLRLADIDYSADADLTDVGLAAVMFERDLSNGALKLKLDRAAAQVDGTAELAGVPITLSWKQSLVEKAATRTHYNVKSTLDDAQRKALGFDYLGDALSGPVSVEANYDLSANKRARAVAMLDLKDSSLDVKQINWKKAAGVPASAQLALELADDKVTLIRDATVQGGGMDAKATLSFDDKGMSNIAIDHVIGGANDFKGSIGRDAPGTWRVIVAGKSFDATGLADQLEKSKPDGGAEPPLVIDVNLDRLLLGPGREALEVAASLVSNGPHWTSAAVDLKFSNLTGAALRYGAAQPPFSMTTNNFGAFIKLLGIFDDMVGGQFELAGHTEDRDGVRILIAKADGNDYRVVRAPVLAKLLSVASLSGINALLTGQGIPFNRLQGDVEISTGKIKLDNMRAYGGAIGINASGTIDREAGQMNVSGTLVPAYTLNSVIGNIPVLGDILVGGAGQGVFASNFRIFGPFSNPDVSVNALSTLAPGFLRNLFLFSPRGP